MITPNQLVTPKIRLYILVGWATFLILLWSILKPAVFPNPLEVIQAIPSLWSEGLGSEIWSSLSINLEALILSSLIGLPICYLSRIPILSPLSGLLANLRFVGSAVFFLPLVLILPTGHDVKLALLTLGELFYLVTTMVGVVSEIPNFRFDDTRTLRMSEWKAIWYVNIRGTFASSISAIRDNAAMGWSSLMFVEGIVRSEGGVGVMLLNQEKHLNLANVWGIILSILLVGLVQDYILTQVRKVVCPYV